MADAPGTGGMRRPHAKTLSAPWLEFDLAREQDLLEREGEWSNGQNARTLVKHEDLRIVLIALRTGASIPEHRAPGRISIQTIRGHIRVRAEGRTFSLPAGGLLILDSKVPHDVEAVEESAFLLTLVRPTPSPEAKDG
jgi:quercetin dioxygenase-like cupin family protein